MEQKIHSILIDNNISPTVKLEKDFMQLTKDIATGYAKWAVDNYSVDFEGFRFPVFINHTEYTNEQLLNKYLENLK